MAKIFLDIFNGILIKNWTFKIFDYTHVQLNGSQVRLSKFNTLLAPKDCLNTQLICLKRPLKKKTKN